MMRKLSCAILFAAISATSGLTAARAESRLLPIRQALNSPSAQAKLDPGVRLFFGKQRHPPVTKTIGVWPSHKRANIFGRSGLEACERSFLSAIISLQGRARRERANAVVDIVSSYENAVNVSETEYVCGSVGLRAGVALEGKVVTLGR